MGTPPSVKMYKLATLKGAAFLVEKLLCCPRGGPIRRNLTPGPSTLVAALVPSRRHGVYSAGVSTICQAGGARAEHV